MIVLRGILLNIDELNFIFERIKDLWITHTKEGKDVHKFISPRLEERGPQNP